MATLCLVNVCCIFSVNEWTFGTVTTPPDFSCAFYFLDLSLLITFFLFICSLTFFIAQSGNHMYGGLLLCVLPLVYGLLLP